MCQVEGDYPDNNGYKGKSKFCLNADHDFNYGTWMPPIHWNGYVGGKKVEFVQNSNGAKHLHDFEWSSFPSELEYSKGYIIEAIDKAMEREMN